MRLDEVTFLFQDPVAMVVGQILIVLAIRLMLNVFRVAGIGIWTGRPAPRKMITLAVAVAVPFVPLPALVVFFRVCLAMLLAAFVYALAVATPWGWRRLLEPRIRSRLRKLKEAGWTIAPLDRPTYLLRSWTKELEKIGFARVTIGAHAQGMVRAVLVKPGDGLIADIVDQAIRLDRMPFPSVNLISVMPAGRGALSTSIGPRVRRSERLITQHAGVVPPAKLLARHQEARRLLFDQGIGFVPIEASDAMQVLAWVSDEIVDGLLAAPAGSLKVRIRELFNKRLVASMLDEPDMLEHIQALGVQAPEPTAPGPVVRGSDPAGP